MEKYFLKKICKSFSGNREQKAMFLVVSRSDHEGRTYTLVLTTHYLRARKVGRLETNWLNPRMDNFVKEAHKKLPLYSKLFQLVCNLYHNKPERNCHKNDVMKLIRLFLWVAQLQTPSFLIFQFILNLQKSHSKLIQCHWIYFHPINTDFCTAQT